MITTKLTQIRDAILSKNTYFDNGYYDAYQSVEGVVRGVDEDLFPKDTLGDYFYLRQPDSFSLIDKDIYRLSDCLEPLAYSGEIVLVAYMAKADSDVLLMNLLYTLLSVGDVRMTKAITQPERVVLQEMSKASKETQNAAMARINNAAIVSVSFILEQGIYPNCIVDPCKC